MAPLSLGPIGLLTFEVHSGQTLRMRMPLQMSLFKVTLICSQSAPSLDLVSRYFRASDFHLKMMRLPAPLLLLLLPSFSFCELLPGKMISFKSQPGDNWLLPQNRFCLGTKKVPKQLQLYWGVLSMVLVGPGFDLQWASETIHLKRGKAGFQIH